MTIDAMGTQKEIAKTICSKRADYVLALKRNQSSLTEDVRLFFEDADVQEETKKRGAYRSQTEKAHGQMEQREYYQSENIGWLSQKNNGRG